MVNTLGEGAGFVHLSGHGSPGVWFAKDFVQNGQLLIYDTQGTKLSKHMVGIIPGNVGFYYE